MNFLWPILRHYYLALGMVDVSEPAIDYVLSKAGCVMVIVVGGAKEALEAVPGAADLVLRDRKGFVRRAIISGASLVPVYGFGENSLFGDQITGSVIRKIQNFILNIPGARLGLVLPKRIFPRCTPVHVVVGKPIDVKKQHQPDPRYVDKIHARYMRELQKLYSSYNKKYKLACNDDNNNNNINNNINNNDNNINNNNAKKITFLPARCPYDVCGRACRCL